MKTYQQVISLPIDKVGSETVIEESCNESQKCQEADNNNIQSMCPMELNNAQNTSNQGPLTIEYLLECILVKGLYDEKIP